MLVGLFRYPTEAAFNKLLRLIMHFAGGLIQRQASLREMEIPRHDLSRQVWVYISRCNSLGTDDGEKINISGGVQGLGPE